MPDVLGGLLRNRGYYPGMPLEAATARARGQLIPDVKSALLAPARLMTAGADRKRSDPRYGGPGLLGDVSYAIDPAVALGGTGNVLAMALPVGGPKGLLGPRAKPFYSELENIVAKIPMKKASPQQWEGTLKNSPGFKPEEYEWLGVGDWLKKQEGTVTKEQLAKHIDENKVQVEEVLYGKPETPVKKPTGPRAPRGPQMRDMFTGRMRAVREPTHASLEDISTVMDQARNHWRELQNDLAVALGGRDREMAGRTNPEYPVVGPWVDRIRAGDRAAAAEAVPILRRRRERLDRPAVMQTNDEGGAVLSADQPFKKTSYEHSTLPGLGGKNYRELLLKLPGVEQLPPHLQGRNWAQAHGFDVADVINNQTAAGQAWQRALRAEGYPKENFQTGHWPDDPNTLAHIRFKDYTDFEGKKVLGIHEIQSDWHQRGQRRGYRGADPDLKNKIANARELYEEAQRQYDTHGLQELDRVRGELNRAKGTEAEASWRYEFNRVLKESADYQQRRDLLGDNLRRLRDREEQAVPNAPLKTKWHELSLKRMIKWAADNGYDKVAWPSTAQQVARIENWGHIRKTDDGKWIIRGNQDVTPIVERYLTDLPRAANKLGAKYGAKTENTFFTSGTGRNYQEEQFTALPVTKELREQAHTKGFSTFAVPGAVAGGLLAKKVSEKREKEAYQNARGLLGR